MLAMRFFLLRFFLIFPVLAQPALAQPSPAQPDYSATPAGVCRLYNLAGYSVINESGNLEPIADYCDRQVAVLNAQAAIAAAQAQPHAREFWQNFRSTASLAALDYAATLDPEAVLSYSQQICPFVKQHSLPDLRQLQADRQLFPAFEVAVTVAAIQTYCPTYQTQLGR